MAREAEGSTHIKSERPEAEARAACPRGASVNDETRQPDRRCHLEWKGASSALLRVARPTRTRIRTQASTTPAPYRQEGTEWRAPRGRLGRAHRPGWGGPAW